MGTWRGCRNRRLRCRHAPRQLPSRPRPRGSQSGIGWDRIAASATACTNAGSACDAPRSITLLVALPPRAATCKKFDGMSWRQALRDISGRATARTGTYTRVGWMAWVGRRRLGVSCKQLILTARSDFHFLRLECFRLKACETLVALQVQIHCDLADTKCLSPGQFHIWIFRCSFGWKRQKRRRALESIAFMAMS